MNIGPGPNGDWDPVAYDRLKQIGNWMQINGEGIYNSTSIAPYSENNVYYTKSDHSNTVYAFVLSEKDVVTLPGQLHFHLTHPGKVKKISLLGNSHKLKWTADNNGLLINIPASLQSQNGLTQAAVFKIQY